MPTTVLRSIRKLVLAAILSCLPASAAALVIGDLVEIEIPEGWDVYDSLALPIHLVALDEHAELLIYLSELPPDDGVHDVETFEYAVSGVIDDVILSLPESYLLSSTGTDEGDHARFVLDFVSSDSTSSRPLRHRLVGLVYTVANGSQLLITLWARGDRNVYDLWKSDAAQIQDNARFVGDHRASVWSAQNDLVRWLAILLLAVVGLLLLFRRAYQARGTSTNALP